MASEFNPQNCTDDAKLNLTAPATSLRKKLVSQCAANLELNVCYKSESSASWEDYTESDKKPLFDFFCVCVERSDENMSEILVSKAKDFKG